MTKGIRRICKFYGLSQLDIAQEELAELIQAISKYKRYGDEKRKLIEEEIADVEIMIEQVIFLTECDRLNVDALKDYKIARQLERIKYGG